MTSNLSRCPLCLEPVALCSCDETEREVAMAARTLRTLSEPGAKESQQLMETSGENAPLRALAAPGSESVFACTDPERDWIRDQEEASSRGAV